MSEVNIVNTTVIGGLEAQLADMRQAVELRDTMLRLTANADFRKLITVGYMKDAAADFVRESADPALNQDQREHALAAAQAPGHLKRWVVSIFQMGQAAEDRIVELHAAIEEERANPFNGDDE